MTRESVVHHLIVLEIPDISDTSEWEYEVEHDETCERAEIYRGTEHLMTEWRCWVQYEIDNGTEDVIDMLDHIDAPGRYPFVAWQDTFHTVVGTEHSSGLRQWNEIKQGLELEG